MIRDIKSTDIIKYTSSQGALLRLFEISNDATEMRTKLAAYIIQLFSSITGKAPPVFT